MGATQGHLRKRERKKKPLKEAHAPFTSSGVSIFHEVIFFLGIWGKK